VMGNVPSVPGFPSRTTGPKSQPEICIRGISLDSLEGIRREFAFLHGKDISMTIWLFLLQAAEGTGNSAHENGAMGAIITAVASIVLTLLGGLWLDKRRAKDKSAIELSSKKSLEEQEAAHKTQLEKVKGSIQERLDGYKNYLDMEKEAFMVKLHRLSKEFDELKEDMDALVNAALLVKSAADNLRHTADLSPEAERTWMNITLEAFRKMTRYFTLTKNSNEPEYQNLQRAAVAMFVAIDPNLSVDGKRDAYKEQMRQCYHKVSDAVSALERFRERQLAAKEKELTDLHRTFRRDMSKEQSA
jgi:hypothetical protein